MTTKTNLDYLLQATATLVERNAASADSGHIDQHQFDAHLSQASEPTRGDALRTTNIPSAADEYYRPAGYRPPHRLQEPAAPSSLASSPPVDSEANRAPARSKTQGDGEPKKLRDEVENSAQPPVVPSNEPNSDAEAKEGAQQVSGDLDAEDATAGIDASRQTLPVQSAVAAATPVNSSQTAGQTINGELDNGAGRAAASAGSGKIGPAKQQGKPVSKTAAGKADAAASAESGRPAAEVALQAVDSATIEPFANAGRPSSDNTSPEPTGSAHSDPPAATARTKMRPSARFKQDRAITADDEPGKSPADAQAASPNTSKADKAAAGHRQGGEKAKGTNDPRHRSNDSAEPRPAERADAAAIANKTAAGATAGAVASDPGNVASTPKADNVPPSRNVKPAGTKGDLPSHMLARSQREHGTTSRKAPAEDSASQPRVDAGRFVGRVAKAIQRASERGGALQLRLNPPELGSVRLRLTLENGALTAKLETESPATRQVLLDHLPALRERLADQNIRIERFDVDVRQEGSSGGQADARASQHEQREQQPHQAPPQRHAGRTQSDADTRRAAPTINSRSSNGGINVLA